MSPTPLVWLITGCSSGIGRALAIAAVERGDKVIATARPTSFHTLKDLEASGAHIMELDVTATLDSLKELASKTVKVYGRVDVVVNNAGFAVTGSLEETSHEETLTQFNTNLFGALNVSRAFLPYMRERKTGTICFIGSLAGWSPLPFNGLYATTKYALRGLSSTLHEEIAPFGLRSICIDLGMFRTPVIDKRLRGGPASEGYKDASQSCESALLAMSGDQRGDPRRGSDAIIDVVKGEGLAAGKPFPCGLFLGADSYQVVKTHCEEALARLKEWEEVTISTDYCQ